MWFFAAALQLHNRQKEKEKKNLCVSRNKTQTRFAHKEIDFQMFHAHFSLVLNCNPHVIVSENFNFIPLTRKEKKKLFKHTNVKLPFFYYNANSRSQNIIFSSLGWLEPSLYMCFSKKNGGIILYFVYLWWHLRDFSHNPFKLGISLCLLLVQQSNFFRKFSRICHFFLPLFRKAHTEFSTEIFFLTPSIFVTVYDFKHINLSSLF